MSISFFEYGPVELQGFSVDFPFLWRASGQRTYAHTADAAASAFSGSCRGEGRMKGFRGRTSHRSLFCRTVGKRSAARRFPENVLSPLPSSPSFCSCCRVDASLITIPSHPTAKKSTAAALILLCLRFSGWRCASHPPRHVSLLMLYCRGRGRREEGGEKREEGGRWTEVGDGRKTEEGGKKEEEGLHAD